MQIFSESFLSQEVMFFPFLLQEPKSTKLLEDYRNKEDVKIVDAVKELGITIHHMSCEVNYT